MELCGEKEDMICRWETWTYGKVWANIDEKFVKIWSKILEKVRQKLSNDHEPRTQT